MARHSKTGHATPSLVLQSTRRCRSAGRSYASTRGDDPPADIGKASQSDGGDGGFHCVCQTLWQLEEGPAVGTQLRELSRHYAFAGRQLHDANLVATMIAHG
jgi:hypothetical protein